MKTLLLIRHAKSSWNDSSLTDFERPLNERGKHDAPAMANKIHDRKININLFVTSPAKRAKKTADFFMTAYDAKEKNLLVIPTLYEASIKNFYNAVENFPDKNDVVALFAHNPGITDFINSLECYPVYEMPTCGVFAVEIKTEKWIDFRTSEKQFLFFDYPKNN